MSFSTVEWKWNLVRADAELIASPALVREAVRPVVESTWQCGIRSPRIPSETERSDSNEEVFETEHRQLNANHRGKRPIVHAKACPGNLPLARHLPDHWEISRTGFGTNFGLTKTQPRCEAIHSQYSPAAGSRLYNEFLKFLRRVIDPKLKRPRSLKPKQNQNLQTKAPPDCQRRWASQPRVNIGRIPHPSLRPANNRTSSLRKCGSTYSISNGSRSPASANPKRGVSVQVSG
ncbi:hypothetical protein DFH06DRAFT_1135796 [Mycena polygramma]|nr:hypothetical protein DFH06DRAFT_1135796 [Mycena polygramma]